MDILKDTDVPIKTKSKSKIKKPDTINTDTKNTDNELLNNLEIEEKNMWTQNESQLDFLYPSLNDPLFSKKISEKKEFNDTKYNGEIKDIKTESEKLCNSDFELAPHQQFVKNFLSFETPYNSLLLFHGLGSGKTCSAIGVAEEMRDYLKQIGIDKRIIIVASPNVQDNFKLQLFDPSKLKLEGGVWNIKSCTGNKFIREINPLNTEGLTREKVISSIKSIINSSYLFLGYIEFANFIMKKSAVPENIGLNKDKVMKKQLKETFDNRLIIIDEVHNIRASDDNKNKRTLNELIKLIKNANNLRLLFLSATPLYNNFKEIISLINIMNLNDKRSLISAKEVFDSDGKFLVNERGEEIGKELLERKATGYISFVRGDNPYTFPFKIWPDTFSPEDTIKDKIYPRMQINSKEITTPIQFLSLFNVPVSGYQDLGYNFIIESLSSSEKSNIENFDQLGYMQLQQPIEALNIVYPNIQLEENDLDAKINSKVLVGKEGLCSVMTYKESFTPPSKTKFNYKEEVLERNGRIFAPFNIGTYSAKIKAITDNIMNSNGVILIYSQYLDGGLVPIALALEEMGITRYGSTPSLFETPPVQNLDLNTYTNTNSKDAIPAKYVMITGDPKLSPNNQQDVKSATKNSNLNGDEVKIILISQAGSEGIDLKFIRQVHILEPWYNLSRIEQIIGRAVRNCSHKDLPLQERNVQIFLYASELIDDSIEAADFYVYRLAERKAAQIGRVTRLLKEISVDCLLNKEQMNFIEEKMDSTIQQKLSNGKTIDYKIGDKPYSAQCDFMESCMYKCKPSDVIGEINNSTYSENFIKVNNDKIISRIKSLFKEKYFYKKQDLINQINIIRNYPLVQIYSALTQLISDKSEKISDKYNRSGYLINIGIYYLFQPDELDENISIYERRAPIPFKNKHIKVNISDVANLLETKNMDIDETLDKTKDETLDKTKDETLDKIVDVAEEVKTPESLPLENQPEIKAGKEVINKMFLNYETALTKQIILKGEKDIWYKNAYGVLKELENNGTSIEILKEVLVNHMIDMLFFNEILNVLNYLYRFPELSDFEEKVKTYFENKIIKNNDITGILLPNWDSKTKKSINTLIVLEDKWKLAEPEDYKDLEKEIKNLKLAKDSINNLYGFITNFKNNLMVFKVKDNKPGFTGARCDQAGKLSFDRLNSIINKKKYDEAYIKKNSTPYLCVLEEILLRINDYNKYNGKRWFLTQIEENFNLLKQN